MLVQVREKWALDELALTQSSWAEKRWNGKILFSRKMRAHRATSCP